MAHDIIVMVGNDTGDHWYAMVMDNRFRKVSLFFKSDHYNNYLRLSIDRIPDFKFSNCSYIFHITYQITYYDSGTFTSNQMRERCLFHFKLVEDFRMYLR